MSISTENLLNSISGFSQGAFSTVNTGLIGNGWGMNTSTYFTTKNTQEFTDYEISSTGGLSLDLYNLFEMHPIEKLNFTADFSEFSSYNITINPNYYFRCSISENILNIIPNTQKLKEDKFPTKVFIVPIFFKSNDKEDVINLKIIYNSVKQIEFSPIEKTFQYDNLNLSIELNSLIKEATGNIEDKIEIKFLNSKPLSDYNLTKNDIISNNCINMDKISILNPTFILIYKDPDFSTNYEFKLNFIYRENKPSPTLIPDIFITITPKDAEIVDIKSYVTGDTYLLDCIEFGVWNRPEADDYFKLQLSKNFITVIPYTEDIIGNENKVETTEFIKKIKYITPHTSGLFNLHVILDMKNASYNLEDYKYLTPNLTVKQLKISNKNLADLDKPLNLLGFVKNHYFSSKSGINNIGQIKAELVSPTLTNLEINHVNGINLYSIGETSAGMLKLKFNFPFSQFQILNLNVIEDTPLFKEYFNVSPIIFNVSKNSANNINLIDHVFTDQENYKYLEFEYDSLIFDNPNGYLFSINPSMYDHLILEDSIIEGKIKLKLTNKFVDENTKDDFGNIIGYREVPYTIILSTKNDMVDTSLELETTDIKFYFSETQKYLETINFKQKMLQGFDNTKYENNEIEILNVTIDPLSTKSSGIFKQGIKIEDKVWIQLEPSTYLELLFNSLTWTSTNEKLILNIEYKNSDNEVKNYIQNIYFYKL